MYYLHYTNPSQGLQTIGLEKSKDIPDKILRWMEQDNASYFRSMNWNFKNSFITQRDWNKYTCPVCSAIYFTKGPLNTCGSYKCENGYSFLQDIKPKTFLGISKGLVRVKNCLHRKGYKIHAPIPIIRQGERTLFASTAGQVFDKYIYGTRVPSKDILTWAVAQPVVRLQGYTSIGNIEGFSSSFIHASIEIWNGSFESFLSSLNEWIDILSDLGLYAQLLSLKVKEEINDWLGIIVPTFSFKINYKGLEIGVANYFYNIPQNGSRATLSDVGIGLERVLWAVNKTSSYFDSIGPLDLIIKGEAQVADAIRTTVLIVASEFIDDLKEHRSKLNLLIKRIPVNIDLYSYIEYNYLQWSQLIRPKHDCKDIYETIKRKVDTRKISKVLNSLGKKQNKPLSYEHLLQNLVDTKVLSVDSLRRFIQKH